MAGRQRQRLTAGGAEAHLNQESLLAGLPAADQTSPLLVGADQQLLQDAQGLLSADQAYAAAIQAGDFSSTASPLAEFAGLAAQEGVIGPQFGTIPALIDVGFVDIFAQLAADFGISL